MIRRMKHVTRLRVAAVSAAFFLGGLTAAGFGVRAMNERAKTTTAYLRPRTEVIRQTKVRTVHVRPKAKHVTRPAVQATPAPALRPQVVAVPAAQSAPAVVRAPAKVKSRVSPTGGGEHESGEHERGDD
jgi:hypothetical protein